MSVDLALYAPDTLAAKVEYCRLLADSGLLPDVYRQRPANVLYAIEYGESIGIPAMAAITGIHVIKGKPSASAALVGALVRKAGHKLRVRGNDTCARAVIIRADDPEFEFESVWTLERAVTAGLCTLVNGKPYARDDKGRPTAWERYPAAMLKARATTEAARDACEEVLFGLHYTPEELGADVDEDGIPVSFTVSQDAAPQPEPSRPGGQEQPVDEAEIVPETAPEPDVSVWETDEGKHLLKTLHTLISVKYGPKTDEERHAGFSRFTGRAVTSAKQLTRDEAEKFIAALRKEPDFKPQQPEQPEQPATVPMVPRQAADGNENFRQAEALHRLEQQHAHPGAELEEALRDQIEAAASPNELAAAMSDAVGLRDAGRIDGEAYARLAEAADLRAARARRELSGVAA